MDNKLTTANNEVINELLNRLVITHTATCTNLLKLGETGVNAFTLYNFYSYTSSWQKNNVVRATDAYCMKGLRWGDKRFKTAKKILTDKGIITTVVKRIGKNNQTFIYIHYSPKKHAEVVLSGTSTLQKTNALDIKQIEQNALETKDITNVISQQPRAASKCFNPEGHKSCIENLEYIDTKYKKHLLKEGKNFKFQESIYKAGATDDDIIRIIDHLLKETFYQKNGWDMSTIYQKYISGGGAHVS